MDDLKERLIDLLHYPNITWHTVFRLLKQDPTLSTLYQLRPSDLTLKTPSPKLNNFQLPSPISPFEFIHDQVRQYTANDIHVITFFEKEYPPLLKEIYQPPWALFAKGDLSLLEKEPKLAIVGSRQVSPYGKKALHVLLPEIISNGVLVVSGLAKGTDALAHQGTIENGGRTMAVLAGGLYHIYPKENKPLAIEMMKHHLVLSEYPPDTKPEKWHFPMRNRIISGMSAGTLIIEAKQKSGSLITANYALNEGREVFSLPGSIFNPFSKGTNDLIQQGAKLVTRAEDILEDIHR